VWVKFLEGIGGQLAKRWVATLLTPALIFWVAGLAAITWHDDAAFWTQGLLALVGITPGTWPQTWINESSAYITSELSSLATPPARKQLALLGKQLTWLVGGFLLVTTSAVTAQMFILPVLRWTEGYWPRLLSPLRFLLVALKAWQIGRQRERLRELHFRGLENLSPNELIKYAELDRRERQTPERNLLMPSRLGNVLRAAERQPMNKYGLSGPICWPRLWLVLPDGTKQELAAARSRLDARALILLWSMLFLVWGLWIWWAPILGLVAAAIVYRGMVDAADVYGELVVSTFDVHRMLLYQALRWPLPDNPASERGDGHRVTEYLLRGSMRRHPAFTVPTIPDLPAFPPPAEYKATVRRFIDEVLNKGNLYAADDIFDEQCVIHDPAISNFTNGPEGAKALATTLRTAFPDLRVNLEHLVAEGDVVTGQWTLHGTHTGNFRGAAPTGKQVEAEGISICRFTDGKIVDYQVQFSLQYSANGSA
jgi:predicted ester cyclase